MGSVTNKEQIIIQNCEAKILKSKQEIEQFKKSQEAVQKEYKQHQTQYPQLVFQQIQQFQIYEEYKSYLLDLQRNKNEEFSNHLKGIKNLEKIMNNQKSLKLPTFQPNEFDELDKIKKNQKKREDIRKDVNDLNNQIQNLKNGHIAFQNELINRISLNEQNKSQYDDFKQKIQQLLQQIDKLIKQKKNKEIIGKLEEVKGAIKKQIQKNLNDHKILLEKTQFINKSSNFEDQKKRLLEFRKYLENEQEELKIIDEQLVNIDRELININQIKENFPQDIQDLKLDIQKSQQELQQILKYQYEENEQRIIQFDNLNPDDPIQEELLKLFDFKEQFKRINQAFEKIEQDVFQKCLNEMDGIAKLAQICMKPI